MQAVNYALTKKLFKNNESPERSLTELLATDSFYSIKDDFDRGFVALGQEQYDDQADDRRKDHQGQRPRIEAVCHQNLSVSWLSQGRRSRRRRIRT